ncbi:hypothetical protein DsansV1_C02g0013841 [Dioscorea sansibarensis]
MTFTPSNQGSHFVSASPYEASNILSNFPLRLLRDRKISNVHVKKCPCRSRNFHHYTGKSKVISRYY